MQKLFYEDNKDKARELITKQIQDDWTLDEICDYFHALGYDIFFINGVVKPHFMNTPKKSS